jgi:hypothetical protein
MLAKKISKLDNIKENCFLHNVAFLFCGDKGRKVSMIECWTTFTRIWNSTTKQGTRHSTKNIFNET